MKKVTFLLIGALMCAGSLLMSCQKESKPPADKKPAKEEPADNNSCRSY